MAGALVRSLDGGQTWSGRRRGALQGCYSLAFHATSGDWVYEGGGTGAGGAVSRNAGERWTQPGEGLDRHYRWAVAADPARPEVWYVSVATSPMKSHSEHQAQAALFRAVGGAPWQHLSGGPPQPLDAMPYALLTDPASPGHVYAGLSNGDVQHSTDHADTWKRFPFNLKHISHSLLVFRELKCSSLSNIPTESGRCSHDSGTTCGVCLSVR